MCSYRRFTNEVAGEDSDELLESATDGVRRDVIGKEQAAEQVAKDLERMSRERVLPRFEILEIVARYEATSPEGSTKRCTGLKLARPEENAASRLWLASMWRA